MADKKPRAGKVCYAFDAYLKAERELNSDEVREVDPIYIAQSEQEMMDARRHLGRKLQEAADAIVGKDPEKRRRALADLNVLASKLKV